MQSMSIMKKRMSEAEEQQYYVDMFHRVYYYTECVRHNVDFVTDDEAAIREGMLVAPVQILKQRLASKLQEAVAEPVDNSLNAKVSRYTEWIDSLYELNKDVVHEVREGEPKPKTREEKIADFRKNLVDEIAASKETTREFLIAAGCKTASEANSIGGGVNWRKK
jgi:hypothetical protein